MGQVVLFSVTILSEFGAELYVGTYNYAIVIGPNGRVPCRIGCPFGNLTKKNIF